jgi:hypothetical protein
MCIVIECCIIVTVRVMMFQQYFSNIMGVSFIGGGNRRNRPTCRKSLTNFSISSTPRHERDSNSQL